MLNLGLLTCVFVLVFPTFINTYASEPIPITISGTANKIIFDGKWTHEFEWKQSSLNTYSYAHDASIILRSSHQDNFIYIFLDPITDQYLDVLDDYAVICFDATNNKSHVPDLNDYCFTTSLQGEAGAYQGGYSSNGTKYFNKIQNPDEFIGVSAVSDINDRYTAVPHPSYEFRIPTNLVGRESVYGFYFLVHDGHSENNYTYPQNLESNSDIGTASPDQWGEIYSPDKSLPEFEFPTVSLVLTLVLTLFFIVRKNPLTQIRI